MEDNNENNNQPWLARDALALPGPLHHLPKHMEKLLPKYDLETSGSPEDHIKKFILSIQLMNVQHEDVVFEFFLILLKTHPPLGTSISLLDL
jgi:hypothetical protein